MQLANAFVLPLIGFTSCFTPAQAQTTQPVAPKVKFVPPPPTNKDTPSSRHQERANEFRPKQPQAAKPATSKVKFIPPPDQDAPSGRRQGGASRCPSCKNNVLPLTALVPGDRSKSFLALTLAKYPKFWFYVPYALTPEQLVEFVLQDDKDNYVYKTTFTAPGTPAGIISIPLPATAAPLEIGKQYNWTFSIQDRSNSVFVQGKVQRVALNPTLINQLNAATPREHIALYAAKGIWYDALTALADMHRTNPQDAAIAAQWINLLQSVGLDRIATKPIVECCTLKQ